MPDTKPIPFATQKELRAWYDQHADDATELIIEVYKVGSGHPSVTIPQALDEALCFGWIDGVRWSIDEQRYCQRYTPRTKNSSWSEVNINRFLELRAQGLVRPRGETVFANRNKARDGASRAQVKSATFTPEQATRLAGHPEALAYFQSQPASYRQPAIWWVISAKQPATQARRLEKLIADSAAGRRLRHLTPPRKRRP